MGVPIGWTMPSCATPWIIEPMNSDCLEMASFPTQPLKHLVSFGQDWLTPGTNDYKHNGLALEAIQHRRSKGSQDSLVIQAIASFHTIFLEPRSEFDSALLRIENDVAVYSVERVIEVYIKRDGMTRHQALEFFDYNCEGAYLGPYTPRFEYELEEKDLNENI